MRTWSFYCVDTGVFLPRSFVASAERMVEMNTPAGHRAIPGTFDRLCQRVDISVLPSEVEIDPVTGLPAPWYPPVIDYQPRAPADDQWQTWAWDAEQKLWVASPTLAAVKRDKMQELAAAWQVAMRSGVTVAPGKIAPTDQAAWLDYLSLYLMAQAGWVDTPILLADGTFELLTQAKVQALWDALKGQRRTQMAKLRTLIESVNAAASVAAVDAITWG